MEKIIQEIKTRVGQEVGHPIEVFTYEPEGKPALIAISLAGLHMGVYVEQEALKGAERILIYDVVDQLKMMHQTTFHIHGILCGKCNFVSHGELFCTARRKHRFVTMCQRYNEELTLDKGLNGNLRPVRCEKCLERYPANEV